MSLSILAISGDSFSSIGAIGNADGCTEWVLDEIAEAEAFDLFCSAFGWVFGSSSPRTGADCQEPELIWNSNCNNQIISNFVLWIFTIDLVLAEILNSVRNKEHNNEVWKIFKKKFEINFSDLHDHIFNRASNSHYL